MKFTNTTCYALHAILSLANAGDQQPVSCKRLANGGELPKRFLLQILGRLVKKGILCSVRGADGGYRLDKDPAQISLWEIVEEFDDSVSNPPSQLQELPSHAHLRLTAALERLYVSAKNELERITISDLLRPFDDSSNCKK